MMDYPTWKKKQPNTPQFLHFLKSHQLDAPAAAAAASINSTSTLPKIPSSQYQQQPHGAEIKIPGVGATPVAVSTTLPAAVVQLSQQGMFVVSFWFSTGSLAFYFCLVWFYKND